MAAATERQEALRVAVLSDLHLELHSADDLRGQLAGLEGKADILIAAGDIGRSTEGLWWLGESPIPAAYVLGDLEFSGGEYESLRARMARLARSFPMVTILDDSSTTFDVRGAAIRVVGSTLWTDYCLADRKDPEAGMKRARAAMIGADMLVGQRRWDPEDGASAHGFARAFLAVDLLERGDLTIVATHFSPTPLAIAHRFRNSPLNGCWHSDLHDFMDHVDLWIHGGAHHRSDLIVGGCRVVANPRGRPGPKDFRIKIIELPTQGVRR